MKPAALETFSTTKRVLVFLLIEVLSGPLFFTAYFDFISCSFENSVLKSITEFLFSSDMALVLTVLINAMLISYFAIIILNINIAVSKKGKAIRTAIFMAIGTIVNIISVVVTEFVKASYYLSLM